MEITLIAVTILSLFLAISMGVVAWRLVQEERRRSEARLAAVAADLRSGEGSSVDETPAADRLVREAPVDFGAAGEPAAPVGDLFASPVESTATGWGRMAAGAGAGVVLAVVAAVFLVSGPGDGDVAAPMGDARPPLDLITLGHAADGPFLDISGSVRNPPEAAGVERLSVVALAFDETGTLVATRRTPVEIPALPPGADSPFTIRLLAAGVSRYRISFLLDETTVPHVDRRSPTPAPLPTGDSS